MHPTVSVPARHRPGVILQATLGATALAAAGAGIYLAASAAHRHAPMAAVQGMDPLSPSEFKLILTRLGLDAPSLAAAGLNPTQTRTAVDAVQEHLEEHVQTLRAADSAYASARGTVDTLERLTRSGQAGPEDLSALASARAQLADAGEDRAAALAAAFDAGADTLEPQARAVVEASAAASWDLPPAYVVSQRSETQWVALREALANERIAQRLGEEVDPACASLLASVRGENAVSAALVNLQEPNLTNVTNAWNDAAGD